jgi:hypothetical protein
MRFWVDRHIERETYPKAHLIETLKEERVHAFLGRSRHIERETYPKAPPSLQGERVMRGRGAFRHISLPPACRSCAFG